MSVVGVLAIHLSCVPRVFVRVLSGFSSSLVLPLYMMIVRPRFVPTSEHFNCHYKFILFMSNPDNRFLWPKIERFVDLSAHSRRALLLSGNTNPV